MIGALIALLIVICYKAKRGVLENEVIKGTKIYGFIILIFEIVKDIVALIANSENIVLIIIDLIIAIALIIIVSNIKKIAENIMYKDDG